MPKNLSFQTEMLEKNSMNLSLSKLQEMVKDKEAWCAVVHGFTKSRTQLNDWTTAVWIFSILSVYFYVSKYIFCFSFLFYFFLSHYLIRNVFFFFLVSMSLWIIHFSCLLVNNYWLQFHVMSCKTYLIWFHYEKLFVRIWIT